MTKSSIFDLIGPIMIGPSSSHTAGVLRIARVGYEILGGVPTHAEITFYNSFAKTYQGHGSDRAVIGGLLGYDTDDPRVVSSLGDAKNKLEYRFVGVPSALQLHPNTIKIAMHNAQTTVQLVGISTGGGKIVITQLGGFETRFSAALYTLVVTANDQPGSILHITQTLHRFNIATMTVARQAKHGSACLVIECDDAITGAIQSQIEKLHWVQKISYVPKLY